jgi:hypothetical protein
MNSRNPLASIGRYDFGVSSVRASSDMSELPFAADVV